MPTVLNSEAEMSNFWKQPWDSQGIGCFATDLRKRMSDDDTRTGMFHQMRVTVGDTACSVNGLQGGKILEKIRIILWIQNNSKFSRVLFSMYFQWLRLFGWHYSKINEWIFMKYFSLVGPGQRKWLHFGKDRDLILDMKKTLNFLQRALVDVTTVWVLSSI